MTFDRGTEMSRMTLLLLGITFAFPFLIHHILACNEAVCASVVSKCMLTQSCKCDVKNCSCCKECFVCLDNFFSDCCSCVEMCPKANDSDNLLNKKSHVEDLLEPIPGLFLLLTEMPDEQLRWTSYTYPAHKGVSFFKEFKYTTGTSTRDEKGVIKEEDFPDINCTVAYMSQCMSWNKCKQSCRSMGSSSYRWFHDGCCECVGKNCLNYGLNESKCLKCPIDRQEYDDYPETDEEEYEKGSTLPSKDSSTGAMMEGIDSSVISNM